MSHGPDGKSEVANRRPADPDGPFRGVTRLSAVFTNREFRAIWLAETLSIAGDQLARVALAVLVYDRTTSAGLTGLVYALTFVPSFLGGAFLGGLGDRFQRRTVMVASDLGRAACIGAAAIPQQPLWTLCVLVVAATFLSGPFKAAQQALLPSVLEGGQYTAAMAVRNITSQTAQLVGFAGGGVMVSVLSPSLALALDALSFVVSGLLIARRVRVRPIAAQSRTTLRTQVTSGARLVLADPALRSLAALCWLAGFYIVPEALAAPYAASVGGGAAAVGLLMASDPCGSVVGGFLFAKFVTEERQRQLIGLMGILAGLPLVLCVFRPPIPIAMLLFALSGACATAYNIQGSASFMRRLPDAQRAQGSGLLSSGLITVQGVGALLAGMLADQLAPATTIAAAGACGALVAVAIARAWARAMATESSPKS